MLSTVAIMSLATSYHVLHTTALHITLPTAASTTLLSPQLAITHLLSTLTVFYIALICFLTYLLTAQLLALLRTYAPATPVTALTRLETC